jgi:hypothetical protein
VRWKAQGIGSIFKRCRHFMPTVLRTDTGKVFRETVDATADYDLFTDVTAALIPRH